MTGSGSGTFTLTTFPLSSIFEVAGEQYGVKIFCDGIDDLVYGFVHDQDTSFAALLQQHMVAYDFLIIDGDPITLKRRAVNDDLVVDGTITQSECITRQQGAPAIKINRVDPMSLPRWVEIQYIDPARNYAKNTQDARHIGAPVTGSKLTISIATVISADQARNMAFDVLYRLWAQQFTLAFEHPDLTWEAGDCLDIVMTAGQTYTVLVTESLITKERTNMLKARQLLTRKGTTFTGGEPPSPFATGTDSG